MALIRIPSSIESKVLFTVLKALIGDNDTVNDLAALEVAFKNVKVINILRVVVNKQKSLVTVYINRKKVREFSAVVDLPRATPMRMLDLLSSTVPSEIVSSNTFNLADTVLSRQGGVFWTFSGK